MRHISFRLAMTLCVAGALAACDAGPSGPAAQRVAARMDIVSGNQQTGGAGTELPEPLVVRVVDAQGQPVQGQAVVFRVTAGGGSLFAGVSVSNAQGIAKERWTVGTTVGQAQQVEARGVDNETGEGKVFAVFTATVRAGAPATVVVESGNNQTTTPNTMFPSSFVARVLDVGGNPVPNVTVTFTADKPGAFTPANGLSTTGLAGRGNVRFTPFEPGPVKVFATVSGVPPAVFNGTVTYAPTSVDVSPEATTVRVGERFTLSGTATNASGAIASPPIQWSGFAAAVVSRESASPAPTVTFEARGAGTTQVIGSLDGRADTVTVTVTDLPLTTLNGGTTTICGVNEINRIHCVGGGAARRTDGTIQFAQVAANFAPPTTSIQFCGIATDGRTLCTTDGTTFTDPTAGLALRTLSVKTLTGCGLNAAGTAYCWGRNASGQLGRGTYAASEPIGPVSGGLAFADISLGRHQACGITTAGAAYCWGYGVHGELGTTASTQMCDAQGEAAGVGPCSNVPLAVEGGQTFQAISTGRYHTCAVNGTGVVYCWGLNSTSQLGRPRESCTNAFCFTPAPVNTTLRFTKVASGAAHSCALTSAGEAYCWGANVNGQLGIGGQGSISVFPTPNAVAGNLRFVDIATTHVNGGATCGRTSAGALYCWGEQYGTSPTRVI